MMRRGLAIVAGLLIGASACMAAGYYRQLLLLPRAAAATADPTLLFEWHCETNVVTLGSPVGFSVGATTGSATYGVATTFLTNFVQDGTFSMYIPQNGARSFSWNKSVPILNTATGTIDFWIYRSANVSGYPIDLNVGDNSTNRIRVRMSSGWIRLEHRAGGTYIETTTASSTFATGQWNHAKIRWSQTAVNGQYVRVSMDASTGEGNAVSNTTPIGAWSTTNSGTLRFGDTALDGYDYYIDNVKIYNTWK
jgi:hypothetical protein